MPTVGSKSYDEEVESAERWLRQNPGVGSLPGHRLETGESAEPEQASLSGDVALDYEGSRGVGGGTGSYSDWRNFRSLVSYDGPPKANVDLDAVGDGATLAEWYEANGGVPLVGRGELSPEDLLMQRVVDHVLSFLRPAQVELLRMVVDERMTQAAIAAELGIAQQSVSEQWAVVRQDFRRAFGEHAKEVLSGETEQGP
jgi:hypothetical protein